MKRTPLRRFLVLAGALVLAGGSVSACSGSSDTLSYWMWDTNQVPAYQQCVDAFEQANPGIKVQISQYSWGDYWTKITAGMIAGTAPDVFVDHSAYYPFYVTQDQLVPLDDTVAEAGIDIKTQFGPGIIDNWHGQDGKLYGMPKDWDTVGMFYNSTMLKDAGFSDDELRQATWNPTDGGTFGKILAHLSIDANGKRGDEPGFDSKKVKVYGMATDGTGGTNGQNFWGPFAAALGFQLNDKNPWGTAYNYADPRFLQTEQWLRDMEDKGYIPSPGTFSISADQQLTSGSAAMEIQGSWSASSLIGTKGVSLKIAPTPAGPTGKSVTMRGGVADSVWAGSKNIPAAKKLVLYLGSAACQDVVGAAAVVFPAIPSGTEAAIKAFGDKGIDVTAFTDHMKNGTFVPTPVTEYGTTIDSRTDPVMQAFFLHQAETKDLAALQDSIGQIFRRGY